MKVKQVVALVVFILLIVPSFALASQNADREMVTFQINVIVPESLVNGTSAGCQYALGAKSLWIRASSGGSEATLIYNGSWVRQGDDRSCRFSESVALDIRSDQSFALHKDDLFTVTSEELAGNNVIDIELGFGERLVGYELRKQGELVVPTPTPTPDPETQFRLVERLEGVERAQEAYFSNSNDGYLFTEPWSFDVIEYTFDSHNEASESFPAVCKHADKQSRNLHDGISPKEISVGRLGDESCAYIDGEDGHNLWIVVRVDRHILTVFAFAAGGDTVGFTADWFEGYLGTIPGDSLMPSLADMPRGWTQVGGTKDVTDQAKP